MKTKKIFWGLFFILGAVFVLVNQLGGFVSVGPWSIVLTILFVAILIDSLVKVAFPGIFFSVAFLCIIYAEPLHITAITPWTVLGAALLASIGFSMLFHPKRHYSYSSISNDENMEIIDVEDSEVITVDTSFGGSVKYVNTDQFKKANLRASFAGLKVYFDNAAIPEGRAVIQIEASFSGVELFIPKEWQIINNVNMSFAGLEEKNHNRSDGSIQVTLVGSAKFAGITVIYV